MKTVLLFGFVPVLPSKKIIFSLVLFCMIQFANAQTATTTGLTADNNPSCFGSNITLTATVSPNIATGTVEFFDGALSLGVSGMSGGTAILITASLSAGSHSLTAVYSGDINYSTSNSPVFDQLIDATAPATPGTINGITVQCPSLTEQIYSIVPVTDAGPYNWTVPAGWTITGGAGTETIAVTTGITGQNGNVSVTASNSCGTSASSDLAVTVDNAVPATPGIISGTTPVCPGVTTLVYSISAVTNATSYTWSIPSGWTINAGAGTTSITVSSGSSGGEITVSADNACGNSSVQTKIVVVTPIPATPGTITGTTPVCPSTAGLIYSIAAVPNATSYAWTVPGGWTITAGVNTTSITATSGPSSGNILVAAVNACGSSAAPQTANINPVNATDNTGYTDGTTKITDDITVTTGTLPIRRGYLKFPLTSIPVGVTITASSLKLTNNGSTGSSGSANVVRGLGIGVDPVSASAATIFSNANTGIVYNTATWSNIGQINLTLLAAANTDITNSISSPGYISMGLARGAGGQVYTFFGYTGTNAPILTLTYASVRSFAVMVNPGTPAIPGTITGSTAVCPNTTGLTYSISAVANATTYNWAIPTGWSITAGQGTTSVTVTSGNTGQNGNITVTAGNSCGTSAARTLAVTTYTRPTVSASPASQTTCSGQAIGAITITNPNAVSGTTFTWTRDNTTNLTGIAAGGTGSAVTGNLTNITTIQQTTNFTISATANGCASVSSVNAAVIINPNPVANAGVDQQICAAGSTQIGGNPTASAGLPGYSYLWTAGVSNAAISNPTAPAGTYTVTVTDSRSCSSSDAVTITNGAGAKNWIGAGTGGSGPDNNFNNPLNWSPAGVPGACNDVIIDVDVTSITDFFSGSLAISLAANSTIKSLSVHVGGTVILSTTTFFRLDVNSFQLNILNASTLNTNASTFIATPAKSYINTGGGGIVTYGGDLTSTTSNGCTNFPFYASVNNAGKFYVKGNAALGGIGNDVGNKPSQVIFDGTGTQTISQNSGSQAIYFGNTSTDIGETNSPVVILAGAGSGGFRTIGNLNINNASTLDLAQQVFIRNNAGGAINMAAGSIMKVGNNSGGVGTSNFPSNFISYSFNATSTVDFNASTAQTIIQTPLYGNLTISNTSTKTIVANTNVQNNITIAGSAVLAGGMYQLTLGGNWINYGQSGFNEQTSLVIFNGTGAQSINTTGGEIYYSLTKNASGTLTQLSDVSLQGGGSSTYILSAGVHDAGTFSFNSASGFFAISGGLLKLARLATTLPEFSISPYNVTGGTIELYGAGNQVLRGARAYANLTFSTSGIKTVTSAVPSITGTILTQNSVTLDVNNNTMGGAGTNLTMTGTSLYKTAGTGTKPDAQGTYTLGTGTAIEFSNTAATTEDIRLTAPTYYNVIISGSNVANPSFATGIKFQTGGTFTVKNGGLFKLGASAGFAGASNTSVANTNNPAIVLEDGSTVEYYGGAAGTNPQIITNTIPYYSLNFSGNSVKTGPAGILTVKGNLSNSGSGYVHNSGAVLLNGTSSLNYNSTGTVLNYYNVTVTNPVSFNINGDLNIENILSLGTTGVLNLTTGNIALKSGPANTASLDKISNPNSFSYSGTGRFIVERYIPTGSSHGKTWQFLSAAAFGQSVNATWQEGNAPLVVGSAGLGTTISSEKPGAVARGYDFYTASGPSIKTYDVASNTWVGIDDGVTVTSALQLANAKGYMVFVRGDRSVQTSGAPANPTTFRTVGKLYSPGTDIPPSSPVLSNSLESVGNPYASAIDFTAVVGSSAGIDNKFYVWDPLLPGSSGLGYGGYQLLSSNNAWMPIPGGTTNYPTGTAYTKIQSGQAFFVYSTPGGTVNFNENNKLLGSQLVYRQSLVTERAFLRTYLYGSAGYLADGNVVAFDPAFSNLFDADDAIKLSNTTENFGITNNNIALSLDARQPLTVSDTVFYSLNNVHVQGYRLKIVPQNMYGTVASAFLVDRFTGISTPVSLSDSTLIDFSITNNAGSSSADRFYIVFRPLVPVPVTLSVLSAAWINDKVIAAKWKTDNEISIDHYELERSSDGMHFKNIKHIIPASNNGGTFEYDQFDEHPLPGDNFYRIKLIGISGFVQYSNIARVMTIKPLPVITVYPNPVKEKTICIYFNNLPQGAYHIQLINKQGQVIYSGTIEVSGITMTQKILINKNTSTGTYHLQITAFNGKRYKEWLVIE